LARNDMYDRFTDQARKVLQLANEEAQRQKYEYIGTEHILLGLMADDSNDAVKALKALGIEPERVRQEIEKLPKWPPSSLYLKEWPKTPRAKKVIDNAIDEAGALQHEHVGPEHLLLGLARDTYCVAAAVLLILGADLEVLRRAVQGLPVPPARERHLQDADLELPELLSSIEKLDNLLKQLHEQKVAAIANGDFETAAYLRDCEDRFKKSIQELQGKARQKANDKPEQESR
jgi:hypothetical protein